MGQSYEEQLLASQPFVFSIPPARVAHVGHPVWRLVRYSEEKKSKIAADSERTRQHQETLKAKRQMARISKARLLKADASAELQPLDMSELRSIISTYEGKFVSDEERDLFIQVTSDYLQQVPSGADAFQSFVKLLRKRRG